jgi:hypothetical protein
MKYCYNFCLGSWSRLLVYTNRLVLSTMVDNYLATSLFNYYVSKLIIIITTLPTFISEFLHCEGRLTLLFHISEHLIFRRQRTRIIYLFYGKHLF